MTEFRYSVVIEVSSMTTATISEKGQITLPIEMRRKLGLDAKSRVWVDLKDDKIILRRVRTVAELAGILKPYAKPGATWEQEREAIEQSIAEEAMDVG
jgi:antitoxin PrlF